MEEDFVSLHVFLLPAPQTNSAVKMFVLSTLLSVAIGIQSVLGSPIRARTPYRIKETHFVPRKWIQRGRAPASHVIHLQIGLKQGQFDELERHLYEGITETPSDGEFKLINIQSLILTTIVTATI